MAGEDAESVPPDELQQVLDHRLEIAEKLKGYGFTYVTLDLLGYRTGSMNETLPPEKKA